MAQSNPENPRTYFGDQTQWRSKLPLIAADLSEVEVDRLTGYKMRYFLESHGFPTIQAKRLMFTRWNVGQSSETRLSQRVITEVDESWKLASDPEVTLVEPYIFGNPAEYLSPQDLDKLTNYKWRYSLETYDFTRKQAEKLLFMRWVERSKKESA